MLRILAILVCAILAVPASAVAGGIPPVPAAGEYWYRLEVDGKHAGWSVDRVRDATLDGRPTRTIESELVLHCTWEVDTELELRIGPRRFSGPKHFSIDLSQETESIARYDEDGLAYAEYRSVERGVNARRVVVRRTVHGYEVTASQGTDARRWNVQPEDFDATSNALYELPDLAGRPGDARALRVFDLTTGRVVPRRFAAVEEERRAVLGERRTLVRIEITDESGTIGAWIDKDDGAVSRVVLPGDPEVAVEREEKDKALDFTPPPFELEPEAPPIDPKNAV